MFLVCSLTREQLHDIGHLEKGATLAMAWHGTARHAMGWHGMPWHGMPWHTMPWYGVARHAIAW